MAIQITAKLLKVGFDGVYTKMTSLNVMPKRAGVKHQIAITGAAMMISATVKSKLEVITTPIAAELIKVDLRSWTAISHCKNGNQVRNWTVKPKVTIRVCHEFAVQCGIMIARAITLLSVPSRNISITERTLDTILLECVKAGNANPLVNTRTR